VDFQPRLVENVVIKTLGPDALAAADYVLPFTGPVKRYFKFEMHIIYSLPDLITLVTILACAFNAMAYCGLMLALMSKHDVF
jgi:hypothetical protein